MVQSTVRLPLMRLGHATEDAVMPENCSVGMQGPMTIVITRGATVVTYLYLPLSA